MYELSISDRPVFVNHDDGNDDDDDGMIDDDGEDGDGAEELRPMSGGHGDVHASRHKTHRRGHFPRRVVALFFSLRLCLYHFSPAFRPGPQLELAITVADVHARSQGVAGG